MQNLYERSRQPSRPTPPPQKQQQPSGDFKISFDNPVATRRLYNSRDSVNDSSTRESKGPGSGPTSSAAANGPSPTLNIRRVARDYPESTARSSNEVTAPFSLKERLRERAAERVRREARPLPEEHGARPPGFSSGRRPPRDGSSESRGASRPRRNQRDGGVTANRDRTELMEEKEETDEQAFAKHVEKVKNAPLHQPSLEKVLEMPPAVNGEPINSGIQPESSMARLMAIAKEQAKGDWAHVNWHERTDASLLTERLKLGDADDGEARDKLQEAQKGFDMVVGKWVGGEYNVSERINDNYVGNAIKGIMANGSYDGQNQQDFITQFEKIVGQTDPQPKGKVAKAVEAAARENAMKGRKLSKTTS